MTVRLVTHVDEEIAERVIVRAAREKRSLSQMIGVLLDDALGREPVADSGGSMRPVTAAVHGEPPSRPKRVRDVAPPLQEKFKSDFKPGKKVS